MASRAGRPRPHRPDPDLWADLLPAGLLVALVDRNGEDHGPHVLLGVDGTGEETVLRLHGRPLDPGQVTAVRFGSLRLEPGEWRP